MNLIISIIGQCNFSCSYCYYRQELYHADFSCKAVDVDRFEFFYNKIQEHIETITITGGEPFLHDRLFDFLKLFASKRIVILTNGSLLTKEMIPVFKTYNLDLHISIDRVDVISERQFERPHQLVQSKIMMLLENDFRRIDLSLTLNRDNLESAHDILNFAEMHGISISIGLADYNEGISVLSESYQSQLKDIYRKGYKENSKYYEYLIGFIIDSRKKNKNMLLGACRHFATSIFIDCDEQVYDCFHSRNSIGGIQEDSIGTRIFQSKEQTNQQGKFECFRAACITLM